MSLKLDGKKLAEQVEERLHSVIRKALELGCRPPGLAVIRVGDDPASGIYVSNKKKACDRIGVRSFGEHFSSNASTVEIQRKIEEFNSNELVDGILLQLPLPLGTDEVLLLGTINPDKDADGLHTLNLGRLVKGEPGPRSCTPAGIMCLLSSNQIDLVGKRAVVVGRSILVGRPMALMLQAANATVSVAHSRTTDLKDLTRQAEILVVAAGVPQMIGADHVRKDSVVIDVGIHRITEKSEIAKHGSKRICGDVCSEEVASIASAITPVPGGVGPMTVSMLLVNTVFRWQEHCGLSNSIQDLLP